MSNQVTFVKRNSVPENGGVKVTMKHLQASLKIEQDERYRFEGLLQESQAKVSKLEWDVAMLEAKLVEGPKRERLPETRDSITRHFEIRDVGGATDLYITPGLYEDGRLGEVFIRVGQAGSLASGSLDAVGILMSLALQYGVPLSAMTSKFRGMKFSPAGFTGDVEFPQANSVPDLIAQWLEKRFLPKKEIER